MNGPAGLNALLQGKPGARPQRVDSAPALPLPAARRSGGLPLMQALQQRMSQRDFAPTELPMQDLADLLWAACGVNRQAVGGRTVPRAMDLQEIEVHVALASGLYLYEPVDHRLRLELPQDIRRATGNQDFTGEAALELVYVADHSRVPLVDAEERAAYAHATAGAMAQNVYLYCASQGLATVVRAWIDRGALGAAMGLAAEQQVLLAQTVGLPAPARSAAP